MSKSEIFSTRMALSESQLRAFCKRKRLPAHFIDLDQLDKAGERYYFVFTGEKPNEFNNNSPKHWLLLDGRILFDSYGRSGYKLPPGIHAINNSPKQLQEWGSTVCGEYCAAFLWFTFNNPTIREHEIAEAFSDEFGFTTDREENDKIVFNWFRQRHESEEPKPPGDTASSESEQPATATPSKKKPKI